MTTKHIPSAPVHSPLPIELAPGIHAIDLGLYLAADDCLVISDLQLGIEEYYNSMGVMLPRFNFLEVKKHLKKIFEKKMHFSHIVLDGDIKHEYAKSSNQEWREIIELLELLSLHAAHISIVKGNHDLWIDPIARFAKVDVHNEGLYLEKSNTYLCHGHEIPQSLEYEKATTIVIGHDHPAIELQEGAKREKFKCFLIGHYGKKKLVVLPSFNFAAVGSDPRVSALSPFLKQNLDNFYAWMVEDEVYAFGKLKDLP